ncbi:MAG: response regulator [Gemmatimonadaceae bacterium]|nr:response regulator [Chitinophagaceae bacterium]
MKTEKLEVLIVDDSAVIADRLKDLLSEMPNIQSIQIASNYEEAELEMIEKRPDIILLDINLPDKSGIDLLRMINTKKWPVKVIMITNQVNDYYKSLCKSLGATFFFDKSNEFDCIPEAISKIA